MGGAHWGVQQSPPGLLWAGSGAGAPRGEIGPPAFILTRIQERAAEFADVRLGNRNIRVAVSAISR